MKIRIDIDISARKGSALVPFEYMAESEINCDGKILHCKVMELDQRECLKTLLWTISNGLHSKLREYEELLKEKKVVSIKERG